MKKQRRLISSYHPVLYFLCIWLRRCQRYYQWIFGNKTYSNVFLDQPLEFRVLKHQSVLIRKLGDSDLQLQYNKVVNLKIAIQCINNLLIKPGETFSFCKLVGLPTKKRGFLLGMELSNGEAKAGIGGGLCQIANLLQWLALHSDLTITERNHHSFDPFPDQGRVLPFGSGATVFYNYRDYQLTNNTPDTYQIRLWISDKCLEGELRSNHKTPYKYHIVEKNHAFIKDGEQYYRKNEIWREKIAHRTKENLGVELLIKNCSRVMYTPENFTVVNKQSING